MDAVVATIGAGELAMASRQPPSVGSALVRDATLLKNDQMNQFQSSFFCVEFFLFSAEGSFVTNIHARTIWRRRKKKKWIIGTLPFLFSALPSFTSSSESFFFSFYFAWVAAEVLIILSSVSELSSIQFMFVSLASAAAAYGYPHFGGWCYMHVQRTTYNVHRTHSCKRQPFMK